MKSRLLQHLPIKNLAGVGPVLEKKLHQLNILTVQDLLLHFPFRYENRSLTHHIRDALIGQHTTIAGQILKTEIAIGRRRMLTCLIGDESGRATLRFLNFNQGMKQSLSEGKWVKAYGEIKAGKWGMEIIHPQYQVQSEPNIGEVTAEHYTPIYPLALGVTQSVISKLMQQALQLLKRHPPDEILPAPLVAGLPSLIEALEIIHHPDLDVDIASLQLGQHPAQKRFIIEELLAYHLSMLLLKKENQQQHAHALINQQVLVPRFINSLPFKATKAQCNVITEIEHDMQQTKPMIRLVQGDVGSGKTLVAAVAALLAIEQGYQVALMAPTEILAEQHYHNFSRWLAPFGITVQLLSSSQKGKIKQQIYQSAQQGELALLIGTHAIFYEKVQFAHLALVIIDEQHRFGVNQRLSLWEKGVHQQQYPHQLIMTATPIPRTLAMTLYADLDISIIDELPPGRTPITTVVLSNSRRTDVLARVRQACLEGRQVYWVCTLVEASETLDAQAAERLFESLQQQLPDLTIGLIHGKLKSELKNQVMQNFKCAMIQLLVATTVIEVGVDVPNASLMIIENAERLGLAQLHQLRGRVGRGSAQSHCVLLYQAPLSQIAKRRLQVMRSTTDGFIIAEEDLAIRGTGEILGTKQIGTADFKVVNLIRDQYLIADAQKMARYMQKNAPQQIPLLLECWLFEREKYINV